MLPGAFSAGFGPGTGPTSCGSARLAQRCTANSTSSWTISPAFCRSTVTHPTRVVHCRESAGTDFRRLVLAFRWHAWYSAIHAWYSPNHIFRHNATSSFSSVRAYAFSGVPPSPFAAPECLTTQHQFVVINLSGDDNSTIRFAAATSYSSWTMYGTSNLFYKPVLTDIHSSAYATPHARKYFRSGDFSTASCPQSHSDPVTSRRVRRRRF